MSTAAVGMETNGAPPDWRASLPDDLKGAPSLQKFQDLPSLAKGYTELEKLTGSAVRIPKADATPEEHEKFLARLGRPESPDKYELKAPELPEGMQYDDEKLAGFRSMAHSAGLLPRQAQALLEKYTEYRIQEMKRSSDESKQREEAGLSSLKQEWGADFDKKAASAARAVETYGGKELKELWDSVPLGANAALARAFAKIGEKLAEERVVMGDTRESAGESKDEILLKIETIRKDPNHPYNSKIDNEAKRAAMREMGRLYEKAYGGT